MNDDNARETAWKIHGELGSWTARVDAKASFALTLASAAVAGITALSAKDNALADLHGWARFLLWAGTIVILLGGLSAMFVVMPRLRARKARTEAPANFIYFGHLMHRDPDELVTALKEADVLPILSRQLVNTSEIIWAKHRHVQWSFALLAAGAALVFIASVMA